MTKLNKKLQLEFFEGKNNHVPVCLFEPLKRTFRLFKRDIFNYFSFVFASKNLAGPDPIRIRNTVLIQRTLNHTEIDFTSFRY
jgi:hypothetical protein